jgi:hypothetical protein
MVTTAEPVRYLQAAKRARIANREPKSNGNIVYQHFYLEN